MRWLPFPTALLLTGFVLPAKAAAQVIDHTKARQYVGEDVTIEGPVARVDHARGGALWLSLGRAHPSATVVIVVPAEFAADLGDPKAWEGKTVQVRGRLSTGEAEGIGTRQSTGTPKNPFIVLASASRLTVVTPAKDKEKKRDTVPAR